VGNNCDGLTGVTSVPGIDGSWTSGGTTLDESGSAVLLAAATISVAAAGEDGGALLAEAWAVKATLAASGAEPDTGTETSSS
jgi:hypothetical protein